ncbi:hypothetical protein M3J09_008221 [Ascochyta lentis]
MAAIPLGESSTTTGLTRDAEGLQVDPKGTYPEPVTIIDSHNWLFTHEKSNQSDAQPDDAGLILNEDTDGKDGKKGVCGLSKRALIILTILAAIIIASIAGGVGGYYANKSKTSSTASEDSDDPSPAASAVTSGTTGFAERPCEPASISPPSAPQATPHNIANPYVATGATFKITCRRVPATNGADKVPLHDVRRFIKYNFTSCMDECAGTLECAGVVYAADLTKRVADGSPGANCLLKNGSWVPSEKGANWEASAVRV